MLWFWRYPSNHLSTTVYVLATPPKGCRLQEMKRGLVSELGKHCGPSVGRGLKIAAVMQVTRLSQTGNCDVNPPALTWCDFILLVAW